MMNWESERGGGPANVKRNSTFAGIDKLAAGRREDAENGAV